MSNKYSSPINALITFALTEGRFVSYTVDTRGNPEGVADRLLKIKGEGLTTPLLTDVDAQAKRFGALNADVKFYSPAVSPSSNYHYTIDATEKWLYNYKIEAFKMDVITAQSTEVFSGTLQEFLYKFSPIGAYHDY